VRDEAGARRDRGRLVPLSLDGTLPPLGFRQFQSIDLGGRQGRGKVPHLKDSRRDDRLSKESAAPSPIVQSRNRSRRPRPSL
jgi:hypothetical protein